MSDDKMRAEFETWADYNEYRVCRDNERYDRIETNMVWRAWQAAYAAGRKAAFSEWYAMEFEKWRKQGGERAAEWHAELERYKKEKQPEGER